MNGRLANARFWLSRGLDSFIRSLIRGRQALYLSSCAAANENPHVAALTSSGKRIDKRGLDQLRLHVLDGKVVTAIERRKRA